MGPGRQGADKKQHQYHEQDCAKHWKTLLIESAARRAEEWPAGAPPA
jgi:hypothetical protein